MLPFELWIWCRSVKPWFVYLWQTWHSFLSCRRHPSFSCCFVLCCWASHSRNLILLAPAARKFSLIFLSLVWIRTHCSLYLLAVLFMHKSCDAVVWVSIWCKLDDVTIYKELVSLGEILSLLTLWLNFSAATCWTCISERGDISFVGSVVRSVLLFL